MWYKVNKRYVGSNFIRPVWKPNANTLLYRPLTANSNDYSWNSNNGTWYNVTSYSSDWAYFVGNNQQARIEFPHSLNPWTSFTINFWFKKTDTRSPSFLFANWWYSYKRMLFGAESWKIGLQIGNWSTSDENWTNITTYNTSEWTNITMVRNWASVTIYKNWILAWTHTFSYNPSRWSNIDGFSIMKCSWNSAWTNWPIWYFKDYIIETKLRTAQEVLDYYNQTKSSYWL